jgi:type VI secretion system protein ImpB
MSQLSSMLPTPKPRVHITYEVETEGGVEKKELPFVIGVLGNFTADAEYSTKPLQDKNFLTIDKNNFNDVMAYLQPRLKFAVKNMLDDNSDELNVDMTFNSMEDFLPENIVKKVPELQRLLTMRNQLNDLLNKSELSPELEQSIQSVLQHEQGGV